MILRLVSVVVMATGVGCSTATQSGSASGDRNVLTREQLLATQEADLYGAIAQLRPQWLRARGAARISGRVQVAVFVDDVRRGEIDQLRTIRLEGVDRVEFFSATEATTRWGTDVAGGVIAVTRGR